MKANYEQPVAELFVLFSEENFCLSGGKVGEEGDPGAKFDGDDIFEGGDL